MNKSYGSVTFCVILSCIGAFALVIISVISFLHGEIMFGIGYLAGAIVAFLETAAISCINMNAENISSNNEEIKKLIEENKQLIKKIKEIEGKLE